VNVLQKEAIAARKAVFVFPFVCDIHCAEALAAGLNTQFDMRVDGSLYPFRRDENPSVDAL
jgi:hypothetical protein